MTTTTGPTDADRGKDESEEWAFYQNAAVRALLDHVAQELATEFVRLMRASVVAGTEAQPEKEER